MNNQDIINYCFIDKKGILHNNIVKNKIINMDKTMIDYLNELFKDSQSLIESVYRIKFNIYDRPTCKFCGNSVKYLGKNKYREFCSNKCKGRYYQNLYYQKTGLKSQLLLPEIKEKTKKTLLTKYNVDNISKSQLIKNKKKETFINHYGYENNFCNKEIQYKAINNSLGSINKRINTNLTKYGYEYYGYLLKGTHISNETKQKISKSVSSKEFQEKRYNTMKQNNSFIKSKLEENVYLELLKYFNKEDILRQYKSENYPWRCDFYIKSINTYIEVQGSQFHHFHPFNENNDEDLNELNKLISLSNNHKQYKSIIKTWTIYDVQKRNKAKENNLKYIEIFPKDNYKIIIKNLKNL